MKFLQTTLLAVMIAALFTSCQQGTNAKELLAKDETRKEIMNTIANDSTMHKEMMAAMMSGDHGKMMMGNHDSMMQMMKDNPGMMQGMMNDMMEKCKSDSTMCKNMCKSMMENPQMMNMMQKMKGMDTMKNMDHKMQH